jgi:regulator of protease activity HflC (stomatin/prohibitin superfamily)
MTWIGVIVIIALIILARALKVVKAYERAVIFRIGKLVGVRGPGLFFTIPFFETMVKIDLRAVRFDVPPQKVLTQDEKIARVSMIVSYRITDPEKAVTQVENHHLATSQIAIESLKDVATRAKLLDIL